MTMEQRQLYAKSQMEYNAMKAIVDTAKKDGINESDKKWKTIVIEAQRKQVEAQRNSIKTLLKYGIKPEKIATELNLPLDEVNRIINTL